MIIKKKPNVVQYEPIAKNDLPVFKEQQHKNQHGICPILKKPLLLSDAVVDHKHKKRKTDPIGKNGDGLIRGVIHNSVNQLEGKISSAYARFGLQKMIPLPQLLRNLADYLEKPPIEPKYIHPSELPKAKIPFLTKTEYNLLEKYWKQIAPRSTLPPFRNRAIYKYSNILTLLEKAKVLQEQDKANKVKRRKK